MEAVMVKPKKSTSKTNSVSPRVVQKSKGKSIEQRSTKSDTILSLLRRKQGASLEEMQKSSTSPSGERRYAVAAG
jgi:hypothetical protein